MRMQLAFELKHELIQRTDHALACRATDMPRLHCRDLRLRGRWLHLKRMQSKCNRPDDALGQLLDVFRHYNHGKQCPLADAQDQVTWPTDQDIRVPVSEQRI